MLVSFPDCTWRLQSGNEIIANAERAEIWVATVYPWLLIQTNSQPFLSQCSRDKAFQTPLLGSEFRVDGVNIIHTPVLLQGGAAIKIQTDGSYVQVNEVRQVTVGPGGTTQIIFASTVFTRSQTIHFQDPD